MLAAILAVPAFLSLAAEQRRLWEPVSDTRAALNLGEPRVHPLRFKLFRLDTAAMLGSLERAPVEFSAAARKAPHELALPMPDGAMARFRIEKSPVMHPLLAEKYPEIVTFVGRGIDDPSAAARIDWTIQGFHAQVLSPRGAVYVDPYIKDDVELYASYYKRDFRAPDKTFVCRTEGAPIPAADAAPQAPAGLISGETLRTYRLACAATGEYAQFHGGTVASALSAMVTTINRVTGIYETELAVRLELVPDNDEIIFTNPLTDPYSNYDGAAMLNQNRHTINSTIGLNSYDIGHVFSTGGGGIASVGGVCTILRKAHGVTGSTNPAGDPFDVDYVAHEMGHQFGANHTFNGDSGSCADNRYLLTAYEPGSGSTIMGYAGICGNDNLQAHSDPYFHFASFQEIYSYVSTGGGAGCAAEGATANTPPTANAGPAYVIPKGTPFTLTAAGGDDDGDSLLFAWEERDLGPQRDVSAPDNGSSPLFRSRPPTPEPSRTFPRLVDLLNNTATIGERLPTRARAMLFRCSVRDNRSGGGGVASDDVTITVDGESGPFRVTFPNTSIDLSGPQNVAWDPAGTAGAPVNATNVNILLSTNGGLSFPIMLAAGVPNDGVQPVVLPDLSTTAARIRVEGDGNIFFDVSDADFSIERPDALRVSPIDDLESSGPEGGPFTPQCVGYTVSNAGPLTLVWTSSVSAAMVTVSPQGGTLQSGAAQSVQVCLGPLAATAAAGEYAETVTLSNADTGAEHTRRVYLDVVPWGGRIRFASASFSAREGTATATVTVARVDSASGAVGVSYATSNGTAAAGSDYLAASGTLSWADGDTSAKSFTVAIADDDEFEMGESVDLFLHSPTGGAVLGTLFRAELLIEDDDDNDACGGALVIDATPYSMSRDTSDATSAGDPRVGCVTNFGNGVWYLFVSPSNGLLTVSTSGSDYDTAVGVYTGACGSLTEILCDDDSGPELTSLLTVETAQGCSYYILAGGYEGRVGLLSMSADFGPLPDNDGDGLPDNEDPDDDNDGMPDDWESLYGLDPFDDSDAGEDGDRDRASNLDEYRADTVPTNTASVLKIRIGPGEGALDPALSFDTSTARTYSIIFRTNLFSGAWQGFETNLPGTGGERVVPVTNGALRAFFGVEVSPK